MRGDGATGPSPGSATIVHAGVAKEFRPTDLRLTEVRPGAGRLRPVTAGRRGPHPRSGQRRN